MLSPSYDTSTMAVVRRKRNWMQGPRPPPQWGVVSDMLHMTIKEAAAELDVPISYLRRLCKENGYPSWPGKRIRYMNGTGMLLMLQIDPMKIPDAWFAAGPSQPAKVVEAKKEKKELVTLNLIEKVGSSSSASSKRN